MPSLHRCRPLRHPPPLILPTNLLGDRERTTLLTIIAALAKDAKIDVSKPTKAGTIIAARISAMGYEVAPNTVAGHLRTLRKTLFGEASEIPED